MDDWSRLSDAELLRRNEGAAFAELYRRHVAAVYEWTQARLAWAAGDLTAETFAQAWLSRRRFRDQRDGSARPWLLGIARNVYRSSLQRQQVETRARSRLGLPLDVAAEDGYENVDDRLSARTELQSAVERLPEHERQAVELRVVDELPYAVVAERLGIQPAAARLRVSRALRRLAIATAQEER